MLHLYQESYGVTSCKNNYHNSEFVALGEAVGLHPRLGSGAHLKPADGQFGRLMERNSVEPPTYAVVVAPADKRAYWWDEDRGGKKGSSTLLKYVCGCPSPKNSVRTGRKDLQALCLVCNTIFKPDVVR